MAVPSSTEPKASRDDHAAIAAAVEDIVPPADLAPWFENYSRRHRNRLARDISIIRQYASKSDRILECGSIPPILTIGLSKAGYVVEGVDVDPTRFARSISASQITVHKCDIENEPLPFSDNTFDCVIFNELFEHLRIDPIGTLTDVLRVLKPSGVLLLSTPNLRSLVGVYSFLFRNRGAWCAPHLYQEYKKLSTLGHMGHVREYTTVEVIEFLECVGFKVERVLFRGSERRLPASLVTRFFPNLRRFFTCVARKSDTLIMESEPVKE